MEAAELKTYTDLQAALQEDERLELINGEIIKRPMARYEHGAVQLGLGSELAPYKRNKGPGGWWIATEISDKYSDHYCPSHDLAGWRKERTHDKPTGVMELVPDWVCEITSPGHEKKDLVDNFLLLQKHKVPYYWIISPEDQSLIVYKLIEDMYSLIETIELCKGKIRIEPFLEFEFDLTFVFEN